jgi:hypothetical protein
VVCIRRRGCFARTARCDSSTKEPLVGRRRGFRVRWFYHHVPRSMIHSPFSYLCCVGSLPGVNDAVEASKRQATNTRRKT